MGHCLKFSPFFLNLEASLSFGFESTGCPRELCTLCFLIGVFQDWIHGTYNTIHMKTDKLRFKTSIDTFLEIMGNQSYGQKNLKIENLK